MIRLLAILLITFSLAACSRSEGTQPTLADQCIWNMVGYGCAGSGNGQPSMAAATGTAQEPLDHR